MVGSLASVIGFHIEGLFEHTFGDSEVITLTYFLMALTFCGPACLPQPSGKGRVACPCPLSSEEHHARERQRLP